MLDIDVVIDSCSIKKEIGNAIISKIMDSLQGLSVTQAIELLEECKKEIYVRAKI